MKATVYIWSLFICLMVPQFLSAQDRGEPRLVPYSADYRFKDGLFLNIDDVRANDPIPLSRVVTDLNDYNADFFDEMVVSGNIILYDENGVRASVPTRDIWGYAERGMLFVMLGGRFQRIILEGAISRFIASATTMEQRRFTTEDTIYSFSRSPDPNSVWLKNRSYYSYVTAEGKISLFDFESNTLTGYNVESLGALLERDSVLYSEFTALRKREKKKRMQEYIRRYNADHPLYFPGY